MPQNAPQRENLTPGDTQDMEKRHYSFRKYFIRRVSSATTWTMDLSPDQSLGQPPLYPQTSQPGCQELWEGGLLPDAPGGGPGHPELLQATGFITA